MGKSLQRACSQNSGWNNDAGIIACGRSGRSYYHGECQRWRGLYEDTGCNKCGEQWDTISVAAGTYNENVNVFKSVSLTGAGADITIVQAANSIEPVFSVTVNSVNISGFQLTGATSQAGIYLNYSNDNNLTGNNVSNNFRGIWLSLSSTTISQVTMPRTISTMEFICLLPVTTISQVTMPRTISTMEFICLLQ